MNLETVTMKELRPTLTEVINRVEYQGNPIAVTKNGKVVAVIVSVADYETMEAEERELGGQAIERAIERNEPTIPLDEILGRKSA